MPASSTIIVSIRFFFPFPFSALNATPIPYHPFAPKSPAVASASGDRVASVITALCDLPRAVSSLIRPTLRANENDGTHGHRGNGDFLARNLFSCGLIALPWDRVDDALRAALAIHVGIGDAVRYLKGVLLAKQRKSHGGVIFNVRPTLVKVVGDVLRDVIGGKGVRLLAIDSAVIELGLFGVIHTAFTGGVLAIVFGV
ncbi:exported protein of unknown function [Vibrio tapetis subsp. tapetis]|uniref:Uncharacterized protein n=1 Tax=Vibrio tapetis subsp. tapetis TaxID=1671868 RepID=A0A2N8ZNE0_9VIBR|nr:exported protein of unknown function [Vibrio tapetis subsp. tapetis]